MTSRFLQDSWNIIYRLILPMCKMCLQHALLGHLEQASRFASEIENSVSSWLLWPDVNGDFSGRDIRSDLDILDGARPEEQAFHITGKSRNSIKYWPLLEL